MSELHERIRAARKYAKLSQEELGARCDPPIGKQATGLWESKNPVKRTKPKLHNFVTIHKVTGAPYEWLFSDKSSLSNLWFEGDYVNAQPGWVTTLINAVENLRYSPTDNDINFIVNYLFTVSSGGNMPIKKLELEKTKYSIDEVIQENPEFFAAGELTDHEIAQALMGAYKHKFPDRDLTEEDEREFMKYAKAINS